MEAKAIVGIVVVQFTALIQDDGTSAALLGRRLESRYITPPKEISPT